MKKLLILGILSLGFLLTSCQKNDSCLASDIVGLYIGTQECNEMSVVPITFSVNEGDSDIHIIVDGIATFIDDCDIFGSSVVDGTGREIDGDIDGNKVSFIETIKLNGEIHDRCFWEGVKN